MVGVQEGGGDTTFLGFTPSQVQDFGMVMSIGGYLNQAVGTYYAAQAQRYQLKSQALDLEYRQTMAALNARAAANDAVLELQAGQQEAGRVGLQYRQVRGAHRASAAARGLQGGVGSEAEVAASIEYAKEADMITINANAVRAANAARARGVGLQAEARMAGLGAENARRTAGLISPWMGAGTSLLGSAGSVAREWAASERQSARYRRGGGE